MHLKLFLFLIIGCSISVAGYAQSSSKYLKAINQDNGTLYFIKPVKFKAGKDRFIPDFTFLHKENLPEEVDLRFSLFSKTPLRDISALSFYSGEKELGKTSGPELMYLEKVKGKWHARFSTGIPFSTLLEILAAGENLEIRFHSGETTLTFPANREWAKASGLIKEILMAEIGK
ncbi:MAG: hypothetical protein H6560_26045 [Lewinellaceae bacterium]|nr:hypothetical protein [Lewinellaceae bacterium]